MEGFIRRGEIWLADLGSDKEDCDHIQRGCRPVVVVSNNTANDHSPVIHVVPITSRIYKKGHLPTHVFLNGYTTMGLERHSVAECEQVQPINLCNLIEKRGRVGFYSMLRISDGLQIQFGLTGKYRN